MVTQKLKEMLKQLGLTEYEAKACITLIRFGKCSAEKISAAGEIPLPRVYDTMTSLSEKGLVSISRTRPKKFRIVNLKRFFDILKVDEKKSIENKIKHIDNVSSQFLKTVSSLPLEKLETEKDDLMLTVTKRGINIGDIWNQVQDETKKEVLVFAGDLSWIHSRAKYIKKLTKKGLKYKILWSRGVKEVVPNVKKAVKTGAELRCYNEESSKLRGIISDGKTVYIIQKTLKPGLSLKDMKEGVSWSETSADYTGIMLTGKLIAKVFRNYFHLLWEKSLPAEDFLKKFKTK